MTIVRIIGVYNANGTIGGELAYWVGARLGLAHCALCDITHGLFRERDDWRHCSADLPAPFVTYHRDDQPPHVRLAAGGHTPVVLAELDDGTVRWLLGPAEIEACGGSPDALIGQITLAVARARLGWTT